jgi:hypothetical protein
MTERVPVHDRPLLIVGCQRSGTTLVRRMCSRHRHLDVMPETHLMPLLWGRTRAVRRLGRGGLATWIRQALPRVNAAWGSVDLADRLDAASSRYRRDASELGDDALSDAATIFAEWLDHWRLVSGKSRSGEKTPSHIYYLPELLRAWPRAQAVVMHRDPRAAGCSEWVKHRSIVAAERRFTWFRFAVRWASSVEVARRCERRFGRERVLQLRYEDVVAGPEGAARKLCTFLDEPFDPAMLDVDNRNSSFGRRTASLPGIGRVDSGPRDRWRRVLDPVSVAELEAMTASGMEALGYRRGSTRLLRARVGAGLGARVLAKLAGASPAAFNQLASRKRYPGLGPRDVERRPQREPSSA